MSGEMSDKNLQYMGRIDTAQENAPLFLYAGSWVRIRFTGNHLAVRIKIYPIYNVQKIGYILDGAEGVLELPREGWQEVTCEIPVSSEQTEHTFTLFKRLDASQSYRVLGFELAENAAVLPLPPLPDFKIEVFGDSVSAGAVCEAYDYVAKCDPEPNDGRYDNAWHSFPMVASRLVNAQIHNNAQGGIALLDNTGYFHNGEIGLVSSYNKLCYFPETETGVTDWDFSRYTPDLVIFAVGQNDHCIGGVENQIRSGEARTAWIDVYAKIVRELMERYPHAHFLFTLTVLCHDEDYERLFDELAASLASDRVHRLRFTRTGKATPGHPRIPEQAEMAVELAQWIQSFRAAH